MQQQLQDSRLEESVVAEPVSVSTSPAPSVAAPPEPPPNWIRVVFGVEFLIALNTAFTVWSQVGGQGHLDLLPWYIKLVLVLAMAYSVVKLTAAALRHDSTWNRRSRAWLLMICGVAALMAAITYYYHLHESLDNPDSDENSSTSVCNTSPRLSVFPA